MVLLEFEDGGLEESRELVVISHSAEDDGSSAVHNLAAETGELGVVNLLSHVVAEEVGEESARWTGSESVASKRRRKEKRDAPSRGSVESRRVEGGADKKRELSSVMSHEWTRTRDAAHFFMPTQKLARGTQNRSSFLYQS